MANPLIERVSRHMSLLLHPDGYDVWLDGNATILSVATITEEADFFLKHADERWSTGTSTDDGDWTGGCDKTSDTMRSCPRFRHGVVAVPGLARRLPAEIGPNDTPSVA